MNWFKRFCAAESGSILVMSAFALTAIMGMTGLAVEVGTGYGTKVRNQRVADMAALGAATAYKNSGQSAAVATQVARDIVLSNGLPVTAISLNQAATINATSAWQVQITTAVPIKIASVLTNMASYNVTSSSAASLITINTPGCITAMSASTTAVSASGGASIVATGCAINSNGTITSDNGSAKITAKQITAQAIVQSGGGVTTTPTASNWTFKANGAKDSYKSGSALQAALCQVNKLTNYSDPDNSATCSSLKVAPKVETKSGNPDWNLTYAKRTDSVLASYQTADYNCNYVIPAGDYTIGKLTVGGGCSIAFQGGAGYSLKFDSIDMSGANMSIGDAAVIVVGVFSVNGDNPIMIGNGPHSFGTLTIGGGKKLDLGSGNFNLSTGINVSGGSYLRVAIAAGNTVTIGHDSSISAISVGGTSQVCFTADCSTPTVVSGTFSADGSISEPGSGSTIVFPKTATHVINGDLSLTAAAIFGSGTYYVAGNFSNGTGCVSCIMQGVDVTFVLGGTFTFSGGSNFDLAAPTAASGYGVADMLILTKSSTASSMGGGANGKAAGLIYAPNSAFTSSGGSSISGNGSACMMLVVNSIAATGGGTVNTAACSSLSTASSGTVALIQ